MLIEFRVRNFRSIKDEQILSMVASKDKALPGNTIFSGIKAAPSVLKSAAIYGRNESGKSNLLKAIQFMCGVVRESATVMKPNQKFGLKPFLLDAHTSSEPTQFEITFSNEGVRYQYGFSLTSERIIQEYLLVYKSFKPQKWFERNFDPELKKDIYEFGPNFKSHRYLEEATRDNSLFLSMAAQLNNEQVKVIYNELINNIVVFNEITPLNPQFSITLLQDPEKKQEICKFLADCDISITDIEVVKRKVLQQSLSFKMDQDFIEKADIINSPGEIDELKFHHVTEHGSSIFDLNDESLGTQRLFFLIAPILSILSKGLTLCVDELDSSLHPLLVRRMVEIFHSPALNNQGAQLIFTTHDTSILDNNLFRRDQIWFVDKGRDQASKIYPLTDFSPRKNEAFEKGYLLGRYGGIPFFMNDLES